LVERFAVKGAEEALSHLAEVVKWIKSGCGRGLG